MIRNYLLTALRNIRRSPGYSALNVLSLTAGLAVFLLIFLYARFELSYDRYHANAHRIFRVAKEDPGNYYMGINRFAVTQAPLAPALEKEYPEVLVATRIETSKNALFSRGDRSWLEPLLTWTDPATFEIFSFPLVRGRPNTILREPRSLVLSERAAARIFGDEDPLGRTVTYHVNDKAFDLAVTGIFRDLPPNSHFGMDAVLPFESIASLQGRDLKPWGTYDYYTYVLLRDDADPAALEAKLPALLEKYAGDSAWSRETRFFLQPLTSIHLRSRLNFDIGVNGDIRAVLLALSIAVLVLVIAVINYVNLATARAMQRSREVGLRKTIGARKAQIVGQFLGESFIFAAVSTSLAAGLVAAVLPAFNRFAERSIAFRPLHDPVLGGGLLLLALLVGVAAGAYPAFFVSAFRPAAILKGGRSGGTRGRGVRSVLVVFQFTASIALIICTLAVERQLRFVRDRDVGYNRDHVVVLPGHDSGLRDRLDVLKAELRRVSGVVAVSASTGLPNNIRSQTSAWWPGKPEDLHVPIYVLEADYDFVDLYELKLAAGRNFSRELDVAAEQAGAFLINESAWRAMGVDSPLGLKFGRWGNKEVAGTIVGVLKDFHMHSLHLPIAPLYVCLNPNDFWFWQLSIRIRGDDIPRTLDGLRDVWERFSPRYPFEYSFFDEVFDRAYAVERRTGRLFGAFAGLAVLIAGLGLFGLASYAAVRRTREIGIRKAIGATTGDIVALLAKGFLRWVLLANLAAWPIGFLAMRKWLAGFAYHADLPPALFVGAGLASLVVAALTIGLQTLRAAAANPAESLRHE